MSFGDIESVYIWEHRLLHREELPLGSFTVLVGQNDTGKSTALDALEQLLTGRANVGEGSACVGWMPTPTAALHVGVPESSYVFRGWPSAGPDGTPESGRPGVVEDQGTHQYVAYDRACQRVVGKPSGEPVPRIACVRLDLGDRMTAHDIVARYLRELASQLWRAGDDATSPTWQAEASDLRLFYQRTDPREMPWARYGLDELAVGTYRLLPSFIARSYERVVIRIDTSELDDRFVRSLLDADDGDRLARLWFASVSLVDGRGRPHDFDQLASGVRPWLLAALDVQSRRLKDSTVRLPSERGDVPFEFGEQSPAKWCLYLIDEPERHLHPAAQVMVAQWLHSKLIHKESSVVMATHSPAFLDLPIGDRQIVRCWAQDNDGGRRGRLQQLPADRVRMARELAIDSGLRRSDLFLAGTVPIIVEGKHDQTYVRAAWRRLFDEDPESAGVRVLLSGGWGHIRDRLELLDDIYPPDTPFFLLLDCPKEPAGYRFVRNLVANQERITRAFVLDVGDITFAAPEWRLPDFEHRPAECDSRAWRSTDTVRSKERFIEELIKMVGEDTVHIHPTVVDLLLTIARESLHRQVPAPPSRALHKRPWVAGELVASWP